MIKKFALALLFALQISVLPSWAAETVLIDRITSAEAEQLDIEIPASVPPGYHEVEIEISDDAGVLDTKILTFCKDIDGTIDWASNCPDLQRIFSEEELKPIEIRAELPGYDPAQEVDKSKDTQIAAFAVLAALSAGGAAASGSGSSQSGTPGRREDDSNDPDGDGNGESDEDREGEDDSDEEQDDLSSVSAGGLALVNRKPGRGDLSKTWRSRNTTRSDARYRRVVDRVSLRSPLLARTIADASYLRAIFGSRGKLLVIPGALFGLLALESTNGQAMPPALWIILGIIAIATLDAFAGLVAGVIFTLGITLSGNIFSRDELLTVAGLFIIFYAPALLTSAIRPLRRLVSNRDDSWERATDYGLATLLSGWTIFKLVGGLNALAGVQLLITFQAKEIAYWTAIFVLVRMLLEDFATYAYPQRLREVATPLRETSTIQKIIALELKIFIFVELAMPFVGYNIKLLLGTIVFALPTILGFVLDGKLPKFTFLNRILPAGAFKIVAMVFIGTITAGWIQGSFSNPQTFLAWSFVVLAIPGLILAMLGKMSKEPARDWKQPPFGNTLYRILGVITFILIIQIVRGVDLYAAVFG
jgi:hypothetical protein